MNVLQLAEPFIINKQIKTNNEILFQVCTYQYKQMFVQDDNFKFTSIKSL